MTATRETRADDLERTHRLDDSINTLMQRIQESGHRGWWPYDEFLEDGDEWINTIVWGLRLSMHRTVYPPPGHAFPLAT